MYIPSFDGTSYLELQPIAALLSSYGAYNIQPATTKDASVTLYLTVKTRSTQGTILYSEYHLFLSHVYHITIFKKHSRCFSNESNVWNICNTEKAYKTFTWSMENWDIYIEHQFIYFFKGLVVDLFFLSHTLKLVISGLIYWGFEAVFKTQMSETLYYGAAPSLATTK